MMDVPTKIADIYLYCMLCLESSRRPFSFKIFKGQTDKKNHVEQCTVYNHAIAVCCERGFVSITAYEYRYRTSFVQ